MLCEQHERTLDNDNCVSFEARAFSSGIERACNRALSRSPATAEGSGSRASRTADTRTSSECGAQACHGGRLNRSPFRDSIQPHNTAAMLITAMTPATTNAM